MVNRRWCVALLGAFTVAAIPAACGDGEDERAALEQEELDRELALALEGDTAPPTFEDTAVREPPEAPAPRAPTRQPTATRPRTQPATGTQARESSSPAPRPERRAVVRSVPTGTTFAVHLDQTLSTETNRAGDPFTATLRDPIVGPGGEVLVPSGAKVRGRVTGVAASGRVGETAVLKLAFEAVSFGGRSYPLRATVVEANPERQTRTSTRESAAKVAAGAAAGAILGKVIGDDTESTLKGAVIGAAAGTAIAMGTSDVDAVLPTGSRMVIRLDSPVEVRVR